VASGVQAPAAITDSVDVVWAEIGTLGAPPEAVLR
jgi:hypothetical protein